MGWGEDAVAGVGQAAEPRLVKRLVKRPGAVAKDVDADGAERPPAAGQALAFDAGQRSWSMGTEAAKLRLLQQRPLTSEDHGQTESAREAQGAAGGCGPAPARLQSGSSPAQGATGPSEALAVLSISALLERLARRDPAATAAAVPGPVPGPGPGPGTHTSALASSDRVSNSLAQSRMVSNCLDRPQPPSSGLDQSQAVSIAAPSVTTSLTAQAAPSLTTAQPPDNGTANPPTLPVGQLGITRVTLTSPSRAGISPPPPPPQLQQPQPARAAPPLPAAGLHQAPPPPAVHLGHNSVAGWSSDNSGGRVGTTGTAVAASAASAAYPTPQEIKAGGSGGAGLLGGGGPVSEGCRPGGSGPGPGLGPGPGRAVGRVVAEVHVSGSLPPRLEPNASDSPYGAERTRGPGPVVVVAAAAAEPAGPGRTRFPDSERASEVRLWLSTGGLRCPGAGLAGGLAVFTGGPGPGLGGSRCAGNAVPWSLAA